MAGPDAARCGPARPARAQPATAMYHPARLDDGVAPRAALRALEPHGQVERDPGGWGTPGASHRSPTSYSTSVRRPGRLPQRSFPSCPTAVPAPLGTGKSCSLSPRGSWTHAGAQGPQATGGASPFLGGGAEAPARSSACRQPATAGDWGAEPRLQQGGDWRREQEAGRALGGAGAGRAREGQQATAGWRGAALRTRACSLPAPHLRPSAPIPFPSLGARGFKGPHIWGLRDAGKDASERGMVSGRGDQGRCAGEAAGTEGDLSPADCGAGAEPPRLEWWARVDRCSRRPRTPRRGGVLGAGAQ